MTTVRVPDRVTAAIADIAAGRAVVVVDDADRENEGDLIFAAELATPELVAFMMTACRGLLCVPMPAGALERLRIGQMVEHNTEKMGTAFTVSVDARDGISTGISAADRARTIRLLADPVTMPDELVRPGHMFPLQAKAGGVLRRPGHTEAAVDLARLAGLAPVGVICEIVNDDGTMARQADLEVFADRHGLSMISIAELAAYRRRTEPAVERVAEPLVERVAEARLPTEHGIFRAVGYRGANGEEHLALVFGGVGDSADGDSADGDSADGDSADGDSADGDSADGGANADGVAGPPPLVRVHSECLTGDVFGSLRCDCGPQLQAALATVAAAGRGVVLYLRGHEGRGIGLLHKLRAYRLQDDGADTVDANLELGLPADSRDYGIGASMLADLGVHAVRLLTNNPAKQTGLEAYGLTVSERVPMPVLATTENLAYLTTKRDRMGHDLPGLPELDPAGGVLR